MARAFFQFRSRFLAQGASLLAMALTAGLMLACGGGGGGGGGSNGPTNVAPTISSQPASQTILRGANATFAVSASGTPAPTYQWWKGSSSTPLSGQTNASLSLPNVAVTDEGSYGVLVSNSAGSVNSSPATLTVEWPPVISQHPANQSVTAPSPATFSVAVDAKPSCSSHQWQSSTNGSQWFDVTGATSPSYTTGATSGSMNGTQYRCVCTNSRGTCTSNPATLNVNAATYTLSVSLGTGTTGTPAATNSYAAGTVVNYSYTAQGGYTNLQVRLDGNLVPASGSVTMNAAHTLAVSATASPNTYTVTFVQGAGGTITGNLVQANIPAGGSTTPVTANPGSTWYIFNNWTGAGFATSTNQTLTVTNVTQNLTITANFGGGKVGDQVAIVSGIKQDGQAISLWDYKGSVILIDLSTSWCGPCQASAPHMQTLHTTYAPQGLKVITILTQDTSYHNSNQATLQFWATTYGLSFPVMNDPTRNTNGGTWGGGGTAEHILCGATSAGGTWGFPSYIIVDKNFVIQYFGLGENLSAMTAKITQLLAQ